MSNEEMNKKIEFIVEQQAKFAADIEILREIQAADARRLGDGLLSMIDIVGHLTRTQIRTEETVNRLAKAQAQTEQSLTILINIVERHMGGNGGAESRA